MIGGSTTLKHHHGSTQTARMPSFCQRQNGERRERPQLLSQSQGAGNREQGLKRPLASGATATRASAQDQVTSQPADQPTHHGTCGERQETRDKLQGLEHRRPPSLNQSTNQPSNQSTQCDDPSRMPGARDQSQGLERPPSLDQPTSQPADQPTRRNTTAALALLVVIATLPACRLTDFARIPSSTVDFNRSVEAAQNEILLLNILRAAHGQPQYFSEITLVRGSASLSFSSSGSYTSEKDRGSTVANDALALSGEMITRATEFAPSVGYALSPTFDVSFPRSQEFVNAMMSTIEEESVNAILDLGWEPAQVAALVSEEFYAGECYRKPGLGPSSGKCSAISYSDLKAALGPRLRFVEEDQFSCVGDALDNDKLSDPDVLTKLSAAKLTLVPGSKCADASSRDASAQYLASPGARWTLKVPPKLCGGDENAAAFAAPTERRRHGETDATNACRLQLRTPISLLKFLGEIAADTANGGNANGYRALLDVQAGNGEQPLIQTDFNGQDYHIPMPGLVSQGNVNSGTTLQIVSLILGLQQSSEALQRTGAVQVIGG